MITALTDILDANGNSTTAQDADGTKPVKVARLCAGLRFTFTRSGDLGVTSIAVDGASIPSGAVLPDPTVTGTLTIGGGKITPGKTTTTGAGSSALLAIPLPDNSTFTLMSLGITGRCAGVGVYSLTWASVVFDVAAGSLDDSGVAPVLVGNGFGLPCGLDVDPTWAAGVLSIVVAGPAAVITGAAGANANADTVFAVATGGLTSDLTGKGLTISLVVGAAAGTNGAHAGGSVVWVDATHFKIVGQAFTGYTSNGLAVLTAPPVIAWSGLAIGVTAP